MSIALEPTSAEILRAVSFLAGARRESLATLEARCVRRHLRRGEFLFHEGARFSHLYVVVRGAVAALTTSPRGAPLILHVAGVGETPGHLDLLGSAPYSSSAMALGDVDVLVLAGSDLTFVLDRDPVVLRALALDLAAMARALARTVTDLAFLDLPRRLARLLLELAGDQDRPALSLSQGDIAARLAAARQSVNQALGVLARAGLVTLGEAGSVTGLDAAGLLRFADS